MIAELLADVGVSFVAASFVAPWLSLERSTFLKSFKLFKRSHVGNEGHISYNTSIHLRMVVPSASICGTGSEKGVASHTHELERIFHVGSE
jgi:hypothetical protein